MQRREMHWVYRKSEFETVTEDDGRARPVALLAMSLYSMPTMQDSAASKHTKKQEEIESTDFQAVWQLSKSSRIEMRAAEIHMKFILVLNGIVVFALAVGCCALAVRSYESRRMHRTS